MDEYKPCVRNVVIQRNAERTQKEETDSNLRHCTDIKNVVENKENKTDAVKGGQPCQRISRIVAGLFWTTLCSDVCGGAGTRMAFVAR